jgi:hypothetical protein
MINEVLCKILSTTSVAFFKSSASWGLSPAFWKEEEWVAWFHDNIQNVTHILKKPIHVTKQYCGSKTSKIHIYVIVYTPWHNKYGLNDSTRTFRLFSIIHSHQTESIDRFQMAIKPAKTWQGLLFEFAIGMKNALEFSKKWGDRFNNDPDITESLLTASKRGSSQKIEPPTYAIDRWAKIFHFLNLIG